MAAVLYKSAPVFQRAGVSKRVSQRDTFDDRSDRSSNDRSAGKVRELERIRERRQGGSLRTFWVGSGEQTAGTMGKLSSGFAPELPRDLLWALENGVPIRTTLRLLGLLSSVVVVAYLLPTLIVSGGVPIGELAIAMMGATLWGCVALFGVTHYQRIKARGALVRTFQNSFQPLLDLRTGLSDYLSEFDARTRNYFHCVSSHKVNHYFRLRQIEQGIAALLRDVRHYAGQGNAEAAEHARWLLRQPFYIPERLFQSKAEMVQVPLQALPQITLQLRRELDASVSTLERDITDWRKKANG